MKSLRLLVIPAILFILSSFARADVDLVRDGKPLADIVLETNALSSVSLAASDLQEYIEKISGAKLAITNLPSPDVKNHIYVGPSEHVKKLGVTVDDLKPEGFKIIAKDNYIVFAEKEMKEMK